MSENINDKTAAAGVDTAAGEAPGTFADLGLRPEVLRALGDMGFSAPMEVQRQTVPVVRSGRDVLVQSRTGSGKTAAFGIPLIDGQVDPEQLNVQAIVLLPTRELALQVAAEMARIAAHLNLTVVPVYGGAPMGRQVEQLRAGGQIVCGTPGRILDHIRRGTLKLDKVRCAVLDECDEMLSMGFQEDIERILEHTPAQRQTMLFSATLPEGIKRLARRYLRDPVHLKLSADFVGVAEISHLYYSVSGGNREADLLRILAFENPGRGIVFCNTREETSRVAEFLRSKGMEAEAISSDLSQSDREKVMKQMREGSIRFLVATDVAARGIDIDDISHVFNFSFPDSPESYIHRTGRTGRAGRHGVAVSLIGPAEVGSFYYLKLLYKIKPEERTLPSEIEIQARREGESLTALRKQLSSEPGPQWRALARRVMTGLDAEHLLAGLLRDRLSKTESRPAAAPRATQSILHRPEVGAMAGERTGMTTSEPSGSVGAERAGGTRGERSGALPYAPRTEPGRDARRGRLGEREREGRYGDRNARGPRRGERERPRFDRTAGDDEPVNPERLAAEQALEHATVIEAAPRARAPESGLVAPAPRAPANEGGREEGIEERTRRSRPDRPRVSHEGPRQEAPANQPPRAPGRYNGRAQGEDFMDVWAEGAVDTGAPAAFASPERTSEPVSGADDAGIDDGSDARLYLNLGRKDRVRADDVAELLRDLGAPVPLAAIDVMNTHSYINVDVSRSEQLVNALNGHEYKGRTLVCERAKPRRR